MHTKPSKLAFNAEKDLSHFWEHPCGLFSSNLIDQVVVTGRVKNG